MELGSVFLFLALLVLVGIFVSRPILEKEKFALESTVTRAEHEESLILAERDRILDALKELDFDYALGKLQKEDYPKQRAMLLRKGADILRNLNALQSKSIEDAQGIGEVERAHSISPARVEALMISTGNGEISHKTEPQNSLGELPSDSNDSLNMTPEDDIEVLLANRRRARQEKAAGFCPRCGAPVQRSDLYCPRCGSNLKIK